MSTGPHSRIPVDNDRDRLLAAILDQLWNVTANGSNSSGGMKS